MAKSRRTAQPIFPNAGVEAWYREQLQALVREMAQGMLDDVRRAWKAAGLAQDGRTGFDAVLPGLPPPLVLGNDAKRPTPAILLERALTKWGGLWTHRLNTASRKIAVQFATKSKRATQAAMSKQLRDAGFTIKFKPTRQIKTAYEAVVAEQVGLIKSIPQKYLGDVQTAVFQNVMQGSDLATLADQLQEKYGIAHRRAAFIAKDQNHKAFAAIQRAERLEAGIQESKWFHSHAGKDPRESHLKMDGKYYKIKKGMWDYAVQKYIWPGTEPHCRCTDAPVIPGFD